MESSELHYFKYIALVCLFVKPYRYISVYEPYSYLLSVMSDLRVEKFVSKEQHLRDYVREIERLKDMASQIGSLPVFVPMHLFMLDCNDINSVSCSPLVSRLE